MSKNQASYRHNNFDFEWSFTRELPSLVTRYIDDSDRLPVRRLFAGLCSVLVRAGKDRGTIQLTAQTDNLPPTTIELTVE